jgi:hypothetical protein
MFCNIAGCTTYAMLKELVCNNVGLLQTALIRTVYLSVRYLSVNL